MAIVSWVVAARAWAALRSSPSGPPAPGRWLSCSFAIAVLITNGLIGQAWLSQVLGIAAGGAFPPDDAAALTGFWVIRLVDLGLIVSLSVATAAGVLRGRPGAGRAAPAVGSFLTLEVGAVLAMGVAQL